MFLLIKLNYLDLSILYYALRVDSDNLRQETWKSLIDGEDFEKSSLHIAED